jgi:serine/threonine protein kinase
MIVMKYYGNGNLYQYLDLSNGILTWSNIIDILWSIAGGLERIHVEGKVHRNLHGGNLLVDEKFLIGTRIADVGLHGPCSYHENKSIFGVLPYIAPEVLRGKNYSATSDIYSFGIIMNTISTGRRPWYHKAHDVNLAKDICDGKRLDISVDTPIFYAELMRQCWDDDPEKHQTASYLNEKLGKWITLICDNPNRSEIFEEYSIAEERRQIMISKLPRIYSHPEIHPEAYYTSRPLYFLDF